MTKHVAVQHLQSLGPWVCCYKSYAHCVLKVQSTLPRQSICKRNIFVTFLDIFQITVFFQRIWLEVLCIAAHSWLEEFLKQFYCCVCSGISQRPDGIFSLRFLCYVTQRICSILHYEGKVVTIRPLVKKKPIPYGCQSHSLYLIKNKNNNDQSWFPNFSWERQA